MTGPGDVEIPVQIVDGKFVYATIALAEQVIIAAGYVRDAQRHIWVHSGTGKTAKVVRTESSQFSVRWA